MAEGNQSNAAEPRDRVAARTMLGTDGLATATLTGLRHARVFGLWLAAGLLFGLGLWTQPLWSASIVNWTTDNNLDLSQLAAILLWVGVVWAVVMFGIWVFRPLRPTDEQPWKRLRYRFLFAWLAGLLLLAIWGPTLLVALVSPLVNNVAVLGNPLGLSVIWSTVVFLWLLHRGDGSPTYRRYFGDYRTIYTLLALIFTATSLVDVAAFQSINMRVNGLQASITAARDAMKELNGDKGRVSTGYNTVTEAYNLWVYVDDNYYQRSQGAPPSQDAAAAATADQPAITREDVLARSKSRLPFLLTNARQAEEEAHRALSLVDDTIKLGQSAQSPDQAATWLTQPRAVVQATEAETMAIEPGLLEFEAELQQVDADPTRSLKDLDTILGQKVYVPAYEANSQSVIAQQALEAVQVPTVPLFMWISTFYCVLLLVPWMLLVVFFIRKRDNLTRQILYDLVRLDPELLLLSRAVGTESGAKNEAREDADLIGAMRALQRHLETGSLAFAAETEMEPLLSRLAARAFNNVEYAISIMLLTFLLALGWYFIFYPQTTAGLAGVIQGGGGITQLTSYLVNGSAGNAVVPSPLTFGFAGAYFWIIQMLLRRYLSADLYPAAFLQAVERIIVVFILSLVLTILAQTVAWAAGPAAIVAFATGFYPRAGMRQVITYANKLTRHNLFPTSIERAPLEVLDGMDVWIEARLVEEGVENIQSMATVAPETLVLKTHFSTAQLVDWIDQSILYLHAGERWWKPLRAASIRSASDLLDVAHVIRLDQDPIDAEKEPAPRQIDRIVRAMTTWLPADTNPVAAADGHAPATNDAHSTDSSSPDQATVSMLNVMCDALWPDPNIRYVLNYYGYKLQSGGSDALECAQRSASASVPTAKVSETGGLSETSTRRGPGEKKLTGPA